MMRYVLYRRFGVSMDLVARRDFQVFGRTMLTMGTTEKDTSSNNLAEQEKSHIGIDDNLKEERRIGLSPKEQKKLQKKKPMSSSDSQLLKVAIIGTPNAGKSTLSNKLIGWKFAPVSQKVHTTRYKTLGVLTEENKQVIFLDTPGIITPYKMKQHKLEKSLLVDPHSAVYEADLLAVVVDVSHVWNRTKLDTEILKVLHIHPDKKSILILNKVDLIKRKDILLNIARTLTEGVVAGVKSWTTPKRQNKTDLKQLFEKTSVYKADGTTSSNGMTESAAELQEQDLKIEQFHNIQVEDGITCDSVKHFNDSDREVNLALESGDRHGSKSSEESEPSSKDNEDPESNVEHSSLNLYDEEIWSLYYKKIKNICENIDDKCGWPHFDRVFMVSALSGDGVFDLKEYLLNETYSSSLHYHPSFVTDQNPLALARLCIFEKMLDHLPDEIPYQVKVKLSLWEVTEDNLLRVSFDLLCSKKRHLKHLLGKDGKTIQTIAAEAKQQLMNAFRREMSLQLTARGTGNFYKQDK